MPTLPDDFAPHPARDASRRSMEAVEAGDRAAWLDLFADDAVVQDPVGPSPFDPEGQGHRGKEAIAAFYDAVVGPNESVTFTIERSYAAGNEVANVGTITTTLPGGGGQVFTDLVINYQVGDDGKVTALRAFWEMDRLRFG